MNANTPQTILESGAQSKDARHDEHTAFRCACCRQVKPTAGNGCGTGYAVMPDDRLLCYACADDQQRAEMKDRSRPFSAYVSGDGKTITTWSGGKLADVVRRVPCKLTRRSYLPHYGDEGYSSFRVRDVHGGKWYGRSSPGLCITLRPCA